VSPSVEQPLCCCLPPALPRSCWATAWARLLAAWAGPEPCSPTWSSQANRLSAIALTNGQTFASASMLWKRQIVPPSPPCPAAWLSGTPCTLPLCAAAPAGQSCTHGQFQERRVRPEPGLHRTGQPVFSIWLSVTSYFLKETFTVNSRNK
jgi:hypothetical protein